ncbi:MAG TPA: DUF5990 family protein [Acidimicrobiales bacterium]
MAALRVRIVGERLPGRAFGDCANVHVGIQKGSDVVDLVPGDAPSAVFDVMIVRRDDGGDFRGPYVHGKPGDRFLYLSWGDVDPDTGEFAMFRRAKIMLSAIPAGLLRPTTTSLEAYLSLTDAKGGPVCAAVRPPQITWSSG